MRSRPRLKTISLSLMSFLLCSTSQADLSIIIPSQLGTIKETFKPEFKSSAKTIIYIQDAHCNYEAQKNMAEILEYLAKEHNLRLIMVEGGSGNVGLSFFKGYADKKKREKVADKYLRMGKISGEEYLDMVSDYNFELFGIEDEALYDAHLTAFERVDSIRNRGLRYLKSLSAIVNNLKYLMFSEELRQLEEKSSNYEDGAISLVEYCQYVKEMAYKKGLNLRSYPYLTTFSETARLEKEINFKQAESERNAFVKDLARFLDEKQVKELINKTVVFKSGKITPKEYYSFLQETAKPRLDLEHKYPQAYSYIRYITVSEDINVRDLLKEISLIEEEIKRSCLITVNQRRLYEIAKSLQILVKLSKLELTPEEYEYFQTNRPKFLVTSWINFLSENCSRYNLPMSPAGSNIIDQNLRQLHEFYQLGVVREKSFIDNVVNKMDETDAKLAVLIAGGFHTPGVTRMLKNKGYAYVVVTPVITKRMDSSTYFSVLKGEDTHLEKP